MLPEILSACMTKGNACLWIKKLQGKGVVKDMLMLSIYHVQANKCGLK